MAGAHGGIALYSGKTLAGTVDAPGLGLPLALLPYGRGLLAVFASALALCVPAPRHEQLALIPGEHAIHPDAWQAQHGNACTSFCMLFRRGPVLKAPCPTSYAVYQCPTAPSPLVTMLHEDLWSVEAHGRARI